MASPDRVQWHRLLDPEDLPEGRVTTAVARGRALAVTHFDGQFAAFDNHCPHQGGPLGEGSIERGWLRCPWHGYDYDPLTGQPPPGFTDAPTAYPVELRADGLYVGLPPAAPHVATVADVMVETMVNWGVTHVFGMVGHSNLGLADAFRRQEEAGTLTYVGVRHEGAASFAASAYAKLSRRPAACFAIAGPGATNLLTGLWDAKMDRAPVLALTGQVDSQVVGPGAFQEVDLAAAFGTVAAWRQTVLPDSRHAELMSLALKHAVVERDVAHLIFPNEVQTMPAEGTAAGGPSGRVPEMEIAAPAQAVRRAQQLIEAAKRPLVIVGYGARFHMGGVTALAGRLGAPRRRSKPRGCWLTRTNSRRGCWGAAGPPSPAG